MRHKHYKTFQQRLSDENIKWLKIEVKHFDTWNLLFNELRKRYGKTCKESNAKRSQ